MARERKRFFRELRLRSGGGAALVLVAGLVAVAVAYRQPIAEYLLMVQLRKLGLDRVEFAVGRFNTGLLELQDLRVGDGDDLEIAGIEARFSMTGLFGSRLDALRVSGAHVRGILDEVSESHKTKDISTGTASFMLFGMMNWLYTWYDPDHDPDSQTVADAVKEIFLHGYLKG